MKTTIQTLAVALLLTIGIAGCDSNSGPDPSPVDLELQSLRDATDAFHDFNAGVAAGYAVEVVDPVSGSSYFPGMGVHYLNPQLLDDRFEVEHPELLIYLEDDQGEKKLIAVEYAAPIADLQHPPAAPEGFTGDADHWAVNSTFSLWTLHAWVWMDNQDGQFAPTNPRVP